jgi:protease I
VASIRTDLENAGASWVDREVIEDENLITSRKPTHLVAFSKAILRRPRRPPTTSRRRALIRFSIFFD